MDFLGPIVYFNIGKFLKMVDILEKVKDLKHKLGIKEHGIYEEMASFGTHVDDTNHMHVISN